MRTLVYKRTHHGDPDIDGRFGIHDCMGRVRCWSFEAVIGVGGFGPEPRTHGLAGKINWIGIGAHRTSIEDKRGPIVTFDHFVHYGSGGPEFATLAPNLANRIYSDNIRAIMNGLDAIEKAEVAAILCRASNAPASRHQRGFEPEEHTHTGARRRKRCGAT
jgi:hypothetical protein